jgi:hypothetical protein
MDHDYTYFGVQLHGLYSRFHPAPHPSLLKRTRVCFRTCWLSFSPVGLALWLTDWVTSTSFIFFIYSEAPSPRFGLIVARGMMGYQAVFFHGFAVSALILMPLTV